MSWIIIPEASIFGLANSRQLRECAARELSNINEKKPAPIELQGGGCFSLVPFGKESWIMAAWAGGELHDLTIAEQPLLFVWNGPDESTIVSLPEEELPNVIERLCLMASWGFVDAKKGFRASDNFSEQQARRRSRCLCYTEYS
jgi:hypothetical protein